MEHDMGIRIRQLLTEQNRAFFTNVIVDDVWVIYYNDLVDEDQKGYLKKLRTSPYRNYMRRAPHDEDHILYFSVLDTHNPVKITVRHRHITALSMETKTRRPAAMWRWRTVILTGLCRTSAQTIPEEKERQECPRSWRTSAIRKRGNYYVNISDWN